MLIKSSQYSNPGGEVRWDCHHPSFTVKETGRVSKLSQVMEQVKVSTRQSPHSIFALPSARKDSKVKMKIKNQMGNINPIPSHLKNLGLA